LYQYWGEEKTTAFKGAYKSIIPSASHRALPDAERFVTAFQLFNPKE
jgi:hypothetical protein